jgi:rhodanese-related sulfurtransferase
MSSLKSISPQQAAELVRQGAVLIDIREANEHARERIPGARHHALSLINAGNPVRPGDEVIIFHCLSGARTQANAGRLKPAPDCEAYLLEGGLHAWKRAGLPVAS